MGLELIEGIKTRRSIRKFQDKKVPREVIEGAIEVARFAPSWKNSQSVRYIVVENEALKSVIANDCVLSHEGNKSNIEGAPLLIVITTVDKRAGYERDGSFSTSKENHWQSFDAGIATETLCLALHNAGLGSVIMGIYDEAKVIEAVKVPEGQSVSALLAVGYPDIAPEAPKRKEVEQLITYLD